MVTSRPRFIPDEGRIPPGQGQLAAQDEGGRFAVSDVIVGQPGLFYFCFSMDAIGQSLLLSNFNIISYFEVPDIIAIKYFETLAQEPRLMGAFGHNSR